MKTKETHKFICFIIVMVMAAQYSIGVIQP